MRIKIELEFDEETLGRKWLNPDNFESLLYSKLETTKELLRILSYHEVLEWNVNIVEKNYLQMIIWEIFMVFVKDVMKNERRMSQEITMIKYKKKNG